jgi:hypothetical protein
LAEVPPYRSGYQRDDKHYGDKTAYAELYTRFKYAEHRQKTITIIRSILNPPGARKPSLAFSLQTGAASRRRKPILIILIWLLDQCRSDEQRVWV